MPINPHDPNGIERWTLTLHRLIVERLRADPSACERAIAVLDRWHAQRGPQASDPYMEEWRGLLLQGVDAVERAVCVENDHAATLRGCSPLSFLITPSERQLARQQVMLEVA
jgi:hypothetical protein